MRIIISILIIIFSVNYVEAAVNIQEYIDSFEQSHTPQTAEIFERMIKGSASITAIEKQSVIDEEISNELNSDFIYTDLETCLKMAMKENFDIKIYKAYKKQYYWLYKNSQFQLLPNLYYNYNIQDLQGQYLVGGIVSAKVHEIPIQSILGFEWSTINQGKYFFLVAQSKNIFKSSLYELEFTKEKIVRDVVLAYYDALEKKLEIEVQKINLFDRLEQLKYTVGRFDAGIGTLYDVKRAQAELARAQQEYLNTLYSLRLRQATLANIMGVNVFSPLYPYEISVDMRSLLPNDMSLEDLYKFALNGREDIRAKKHEIKAYRAQRSSNYTDFIPDINISYQNGLVGTKRRGLRGQNSIMMDINIPLGKNILMGTITQIKSDTALVKAKKLELIDLQRNVKENILNYYYQSQNALKKVEASKIETEAANLSLDLSLTNMKAGEATFIDVIASQNLKVQSNINLIKNMIEYNRAQTNLLFEVGLLSPKHVLKGYRTKLN